MSCKRPHVSEKYELSLSGYNCPAYFLFIFYSNPCLIIGMVVMYNYCYHFNHCGRHHANLIITAGSGLKGWVGPMLGWAENLSRWASLNNTTFRIPQTYRSCWVFMGFTLGSHENSVWKSYRQLKVPQFK